MLYILGTLIGFIVGFIAAYIVKEKTVAQLKSVITSLERKVTLAKTRRPFRNYKRNGKKKSANKKIVVSKKSNVDGKRKAKKA